MVVQFSSLGGREGRASVQCQWAVDALRVATVTARLGSCRRLISRPAASTADDGMLLRLGYLMNTPFPRRAPRQRRVLASSRRTNGLRPGMLYLLL
jgi:hypothetical protein